MKINKVTIEMLRIHPDDRRMVFTIEDDEGRKLSYSEMLGDIFLKNLFLKCFWWALRNKEFDFLNF